MFNRVLLAGVALAIGVCSDAQVASSQDAFDGIADACVRQGFTAGTPMYSACYQAGFARRIAVINQAVEMLARRQGDNSPQPHAYGYVMPDGQLVICQLSPDGVTSGCTHDLQLAWP